MVIETALNNNGFVKGINALKNNLGGLTSAAKRLGGVLVTAFGVKVLTGFGKECVELGSNIAEVQNVVDVAFGEMSYKIEQFAATSIRSYGMSKLAAKKTGSTYMAMAKGMGIGNEAASDMAVQLTALSGDVASFFNISQELADTKLKSVFTGETETLKDLGVVMTQTNLKAFALKKGISTNIESMSQAQLTALRYQYVMETLALAQGDFKRTSTSWANQTRILSEQWNDLKSILGQALITVLRPMVVTLNEMVSSMIDVANTINSVVTALFGGAETQLGQTQQGTEEVGDAIKDTTKDQNGLTAAVEKTNKATKKSLADFDEIHRLTTENAANAEVDVPSSGALTGGITAGTGDTVDGLSRKMQAMLGELKSGFADLKSWVTNFFEPFKASWENHGEKVLESLKTRIASMIENVRSIGEAFGEVWADGSGTLFLNTVLSTIATINATVSEMGAKFRLAWNENRNGEAIWRGIMNVVQTVAEFVERIAIATLSWVQQLNLGPITTAFRNLLNAINPVVDAVTDGLAWCYENVLLPLGKWTIEQAAPATLNLLASVANAFTPILEALKPLATWFWEEFLKPIGEWAGEVIIQAITSLTEKLNDFADWARQNPETIQRISEIIFSLLAGLVTYYTVHKIVDVITGIKAAFVSFAEGLGLAQGQAGLAVAAFGTLIYLVMQLAGCWDQMTGIQKVVTILAGVTTAAFAAALAVGAFQSALSMGIAIAAIVAGILALSATLSSVQKKTQQSTQYQRFMGQMSANSTARTPKYAVLSNATVNVPHLAEGAVIPANREFLAVLGDQKSGTNIESPVSEIEAAVSRGIQRAGGNRPVTVVLEVDKQVLGRVTYQATQSERQRVGINLIKG